MLFLPFGALDSQSRPVRNENGKINNPEGENTETPKVAAIAASRMTPGGGESVQAIDIIPCLMSDTNACLVSLLHLLMSLPLRRGSVLKTIKKPLILSLRCGPRLNMSTTAEPLRNVLAKSKSPYLLQHKDNPVAVSRQGQRRNVSRLI